MAELRDGRTVNLDWYDPQYAGRYNAYRCENGHVNLSLDVDEGVTPMFLTCQRPDGPDQTVAGGWCGARSVSEVYPHGEPPPGYFPVRVVWRAATNGERKRERRDFGPDNHYAKGGLALEWHL